jgi:hypothetical protein
MSLVNSMLLPCCPGCSFAIHRAHCITWGCDCSLNVTLRVTPSCGKAQSLSGSVIIPEERQFLTLGSNCHSFMLQALHLPHVRL